MPKIPTEYLDCVFYLYENEVDARNGERAGGTGFVMSVASQLFPQQVIYTYAVTNWHNCCQGRASVVRLNNADGSTDVFDFGAEDWIFSPKYDIAALQIPIDNDKASVLIPIENGITKLDVDGPDAIGVGDDIFMLGRFMDHDGGSINKPAARFGNISVMPAPIEQPNGLKADSFCVDMHSRTGFSGSPVFVYRTLYGDLDAIVDKKRIAQRTFLKFLGIHWGQFPEIWEITAGAEDSKHIAGSRYVKGVSGMTCVLPAWNVFEVLNMPKLKERRELEERLLAQYAKEHGLPPEAETPLFSLNWTGPFKAP